MIVCDRAALKINSTSIFYICVLYKLNNFIKSNHVNYYNWLILDSFKYSKEQSLLDVIATVCLRNSFWEKKFSYIVKKTILIQEK